MKTPCSVKGKRRGHVFELHIPLHLIQRKCARLLQGGAAGVEKLEKVRERRRLQEHAADKAGKHVELADEKIGETDKGHDLANGNLSALGQDGSDGEDGHHRNGCRRPREHGQHRPPCQHGILGAKEVGHQRAKSAGLGEKPRIALHDRSVADNVADPAKYILVILLDALLPAMRSLDDDRVAKEDRARPMRQEALRAASPSKQRQGSGARFRQ